MTQASITLIGGGNMSRGILGGLIKKGHAPELLATVDPNDATRANLAQELGIAVHKEANDECLDVDYLILAVKPQILLKVCDQLGAVWNESTRLSTGSIPKIISIAAGIRCSAIAERLNNITKHKHQVIRAMPNTPALIGLGASGLFSQAMLDAENKAAIADIFSSIGISVWVDSEAQLDTVTALSGSGPAYFFQMMDAMVKAGVAEGLSEDQARKLVIQTAVGAAHMASETIINKQQSSLTELRNSVTSKGGTTEAGLKSLQHDGFSENIQQAIKMAKARSVELADEFGE